MPESNDQVTYIYDRPDETLPPMEGIPPPADGPVWDEMGTTTPAGGPLDDLLPKAGDWLKGALGITDIEREWRLFVERLGVNLVVLLIIAAGLYMLIMPVATRAAYRKFTREDWG